MISSPSRRAAFTLIELLVVIAIIAVLMGLSFPVFQNVQNSAKKTQAKNDVVQIVTATTAFYTEYGRYPSGSTSDVSFGPGSTGNDQLFNDLRGSDFAQFNPRDVTFITPPVAKNASKPANGLGTNGRWYDPWGKEYAIRLDTNYDNKIANPYSANAGYNPVDAGVIAWSLGKNGIGGTGDRNSAASKDDVISWQ